MFGQFLPSLKNIINMEENISSSSRPKYIKLVKTVKSDWIKLQKDIMKTKKVSYCNLNIAACKLCRSSHTEDCQRKGIQKICTKF